MLPLAPTISPSLAPVCRTKSAVCAVRACVCATWQRCREARQRRSGRNGQAKTRVIYGPNVLSPNGRSIVPGERQGQLSEALLTLLIEKVASPPRNRRHHGDGIPA